MQYIESNPGCRGVDFLFDVEKCVNNLINFFWASRWVWGQRSAAFFIYSCIVWLSVRSEICPYYVFFLSFYTFFKEEVLQ